MKPCVHFRVQPTPALCCVCRFGRVLHDPSVLPRQGLTQEQYADKQAAAQQTTINHFHEKLFRLKVNVWLEQPLCLLMMSLCSSWE